MGIYLAITAAAVLATSAAVLILVAGHHVDYQASGNLASLGHWDTAWVVPVQVVFLITVGAFWLAAITRQALSWRRSDGERRQQLKWLASGAAVCGVFGPRRPGQCRAPGAGTGPRVGVDRRSLAITDLGGRLSWFQVGQFAGSMVSVGMTGWA